MTFPDDTDAQAVLRARVEEMMRAGRVRNREGERVAALPETIRANAEALLREPLNEEATLLLMDDGTVEWEATQE